MTAFLIQFPGKGAGLTSEEGRKAAEAVLATPIEERPRQFQELHLEDPEQLLSLCALLWGLGEVEPARARDEAAFFYGFLEEPKRSIGIFDERDYYIGEFALIAGGACRILSKREEAKRWFDLAEASFVLSHNASAHIARLAYQRLALKLEERNFNSVLELAPRWVECFERLGLAEDALKCRFLKAHVLKETERLDEAKQAFRSIKADSEARGIDRLAAMAGQNLFQIHVFLNEVEQAITEAKEAVSVLARQNNRVSLAKLHLGVGFLLCGQRRLPEAIEAFRESQHQFAELEMRADVAAVNLILADLLLDAGQAAQAEWEIRAALPIIDELKLVPEGIAALSLLRDSLRRREIDRQALRSLNGYFEELGS
jgi:tetratricopeptide (TPR) repeat protein